MKMEPIKEKITDKNNYLKVMPFLDNEIVQQEILSVRSQIPAFDKLIDWDKYDEWFEYITQATETRDMHAKMASLYPHECARILENYGRQDIHYHTLWKAIICGEIRDSDCAAVWVDIWNPNYRLSLIPRLVIVFQPESTIEEIKIAFKKRRKQVKEYEQFEIGKGLIRRDITNNKVNIQMLKECRSLYLSYEPNIFGYQKTANTMGVKTDRTAEEKRKDLEKARTKIETYKKRVKRSIRLILSSNNQDTLGK